MRRIYVMLAVIVCMVAGCKSNEKTVLTSQEWQLEKMVTDPQISLPGSVPVIQFTDTMTIYGAAGCNRFFGTYGLEGKDKMKVKPGGMTMMFCPDMEFEDRYIKTLDKIAGYTVSAEKLQLTDSLGNVVLEYIPRDTTKLIGVADDEHGCNKAAGYTWSEVNQNCIRLFESGVQLNSATDSLATLAAYIVFSSDSLKVEVFVPDMEIHPVLDRRDLPAGGYVWNIEDDDTMNVRMADGKWLIEKRGQTLYIQEK